MPETWYVEHAILEEDVVPGKRLGRRVKHDSRSLAYRWQHSGAAPASQLWARRVPIFDQGDVEKQLLFLDNSWGISYGVNGGFSYSYDTLTRLLAEQGDATVSVPVTKPPPIPVPPHPHPGPDANPDDLKLAAATKAWAGQRHLTSGDKKVAAALEAWLHAKGL